LRRLLIRPGGIGDCILSFPAMEFLKADYTEVWVREDVAPLIRFADSVRSIASTGIDLLGLEGIEPPRALIDRLRSFHSIISWYGSNREEFRAEVQKLGLPFQFFSALPVPGESTHAADYFLAQAGSSGRAVPRIDCAPASSGDFAVIHPFSGSPRKNWPIERFQELAGRIGMPVRWCAGPEENLEGAVRIANLYELAGWLRTARIYVGNDSGITHLAAAAGAPVVAIFGPTDPAVWAPRGDRVRVVAGKLDEITVEQVLEAASDTLSKYVL
jgi:lipopolysaccharide heptosyltransferase III